MAVDLTVLRPSTQDWAQEIGTADVEVAFGGSTRTLTGMDAVAYLFGQALSTVTYQNLLDGVQLSDGRFEFPPGSGDSVTLAELSDALRYKYGVDPLIEFAPGLGLRGYSITDINTILERLNREFGGQFSFSLLDVDSVVTAAEATWVTENAGGIWDDATKTATSALFSSTSKAVLSSATEAELRQDLTEGGDVYVDRKGGFFINGVPTTAMDLTVTSRLLAQDNIGSEYKVIMDEYAERNNLIAAASEVVESINASEALTVAQRAAALRSAIENLESTYGEEDILSVLTSGQVRLDSLDPIPTEKLDALGVYFDGLTNKIEELQSFYANAKSAAEIRRTRYVAEGYTSDASDLSNYDMAGRMDALINKIDGWLGELDDGYSAVRALDNALEVSFDDFDDELRGLKNARQGGDVFGWLRSFDVDPEYLWEGNWRSLVVEVKTLVLDTGPRINGQINDTRWRKGDPNLNESDLYSWVATLGEFDPADPYRILGPFDWTLDEFGWRDPNTPTGTNVNKLASLYQIFTEATAKQRLIDSGFPLYTEDNLPSKFPPYYSPETPKLYLEWASQAYYGLLSDQYTGNARDIRVVPEERTLENLMYFWCYRSDFKEEDSSTSDAIWGFFDWNDWRLGEARISLGGSTTTAAYQGSATDFSDEFFLFDEKYENAAALCNTLISNKVRDGELDQAKLQTLTAQLQNNTEAMTALIKAFKDLHAGLSQALR